MAIMRENHESSSAAVTAIVFDIGNVLIDWDPKYLYRKLMPDEASMDRFLAEICHYQWNLEQDRGRLWADAIAEKIAEFPEHEQWIRAYDTRWPEMVSGPIEGSVEILQELKAKAFPLYAITNFSREKWDIATEIYPFLTLFDGVTVSADVKLLKPDPAIYAHFLKSFSLRAETLLFIDDRRENIEAARDAGFQAVLFTTPEALRQDLRAFGVL
jgi:2-haloacid dehalogenase